MPAKRMHFQDMFGGLLPEGDVAYPRPLSAGRRILKIEKSFSSTQIAETVHSTAFFVPSARALVAGDLIFNRYHTEHD